MNSDTEVWRMFEPGMTNIMIGVIPAVAVLPGVRVWAVFILCLVFSASGVGLSFLVLGTTITGYRLWGMALVIAVTMLGITYGAKYANADARESFTPVDLIQYLSQGFLWPSTWPALASLVGIQKIESPKAGGILYDLVSHALYNLAIYF